MKLWRPRNILTEPEQKIQHEIKQLQARCEEAYVEAIALDTTEDKMEEAQCLTVRQETLEDYKKNTKESSQGARKEGTV